MPVAGVATSVEPSLVVAAVAHWFEVSELTASSIPQPEDAGVVGESEKPTARWLTVNGQRHEVHAADDTPLLYVLRNDLGLKGTRFGCGLGLCGACFVLVDGRPIYSCDTPLWSVADKSIRTVEGLAADGEPHPVARALIAGQAAQCGYCMSGIVVTAAALLTDNPEPTEAEVRTALDPNLCRCGSHNRVVRAVLSAAAQMAAEIPGSTDGQR